MSSLLLTGCGTSSGGSPADISGLLLWLNPNIPEKRWQDTGGTTPANEGETVALLQDISGNLRHFSQGTAANEPTLADFGNGVMALQIADSTDFLTANAAALSSTNGVAGLTHCGVYITPPAIGASFGMRRITTNAGGSKFNLYIENADDKIYLQTRRVSADSVDTTIAPATAISGGEALIVIASVDYATGAIVIEVNGSTSGKGVTDTAAWTTGATCEVADPTVSTIPNSATPFTGGMFGEVIEYSKALSSAERAIVRNHLNATWQVF